MQPENSTLIDGVNGLYRMYVDNADSPISGAISGAKVWETETTRLFRENFKPGMTFVDAGAHFGYYSLLAASLGAKRVVAFEPFRHNFEFLKANIELDGLGVEAVNVPLWDGSVKCRMERNGGNTGDAQLKLTGELDQETLVLDELFRPNEVDFIKTDCQGADCRVLQGAKKLLAGSERIQLLTERMASPLDYFGMAEADFFRLMEECGLKQVTLINEEGNYYYRKP